MLPPQSGVTPRVTGSFGENRPNGPHGGVDFNYSGGQTGVNMTKPVIYAPIGGEITFAGGKYGTVKIKDAEGNSHEILHTDSQHVVPGQRVSTGDPIGTMGGRGPKGANQYPVHIHYQLRDSRGRLLNPQQWWDSGFSPSLDGQKSKMETASSMPSPIMVDLDGDGIETINLENGAYFDHTGDGFAELSGWVDVDDGLLVLDMNENGLIDSGRELFGSETLLENGRLAVHGFEALSELDSDTNGILDSSDVLFSSLRIWQDSDGDGYTSDGELMSLEDAGIQYFHLNYQNSSYIDTEGNAHRQIGSYITTGGQARTATDVWVQTDSTYSWATEWVQLPPNIVALPDIQGYGLVRDLHQAMAMDASGELKTLVEAFTHATTPQERDLLVTQLIYHWTGVQDIDPYSRASRSAYGNVIGDARKLEALEVFMGQEWVCVRRTSASLLQHRTVLTPLKMVTAATCGW